MLNSFTFNGRSSEDFGVRVEKYPDLNRSQRKYRSTSVPGKNGNIYQMEDAWEEVPVAYKIFAGSRHKGCAVETFTEIMEWLHSADNYAELSDSFDKTHYRMAVFVDSTDIESEWHTFGRATIRFRCRPERYIAGATQDVENGGSIYNPTNHIAKPIITLNGTGTRSLLQLLDWTMSGTAFANATRQLYSIIADWKLVWVWQYSVGNTKQIRYTGGNDSQLNLDNATGQVGATSTDTERGLGFIQEVAPNTEYTISADVASNNSKIRIWYGASGGYNDILGMEEASASGLKIQHTFKTPAECGYILITFYRTDGTGILFSNVMLVAGSEAKTFKAYSSPVQTDFTIGKVTLSMLSEGFDAAEIDCERENLTIDGVEKNNIASIIDQFGNASVDFLQLIKGDNAVAFSGDIDSVVMDPRIWEL